MQFFIITLFNKKIALFKYLYINYTNYFTMPNHINSFVVKITENPIGGKITQDIILKSPILISDSVSDSVSDHVSDPDSVYEYNSDDHNNIYEQVYQQAYAYYSSIFSLNRS